MYPGRPSPIQPGDLARYSQETYPGTARSTSQVYPVRCVPGHVYPVLCVPGQVVGKPVVSPRVKAVNHRAYSTDEHLNRFLSE